MDTTNIHVEAIDESFVKLHCDISIANEIRDHYTFKKPNFHFIIHKLKKTKPWMKNWDGRIRLFKLREGIFPKGLLSSLASWAWRNGYTITGDLPYKYELKRAEFLSFVEGLNVPKKYAPRDYQIDYALECLQNFRRIILSPTASGKSFIIYLIVRYLHDNNLSNKMLIIVPRVNLVKQLLEDFHDYGMDIDNHVHFIHEGRAKFSRKPVTITTYQSILNMGKDWYDQFDAVVADEVHEYKAESLKTIMERLRRAIYRIGTTGTLDGTETHKMVLIGLFGNVLKKTSTMSLMEQGHISKFSIQTICLNHGSGNRMDYREELDYLIGNEKRNRFIENLALNHCKSHTIILFNYVEKHGKLLYESLKNKYQYVHFVHGKVSAEERDAIRKLVMNDNENKHIIVASYGTYAMGINIPNLTNLILASPSKSRIRNLQSIGRTLRLHPLKEEAKIFDIADKMTYSNGRFNITFGHMKERLNIYESEKFNHKTYEVAL